MSVIDGQSLAVTSFGTPASECSGARDGRGISDLDKSDLQGVCHRHWSFGIVWMYVASM